MAIQDSFNLNQAKNSQAYAYKCWYNYNYGGNTMKISSKDYGEITQSWNGELTNWKATASKDENAYEIADDDFSMAKKSGKDQAKSKAGASGKTGGQITRGVVDGLAGAVGSLSMYTAAGKAVANKLGTKLGGKLVAKSAEKVIGKAGKEAAKKATEEALKNGATKKAAKAAGKEAGKNAASESAKKSANNVGSWSVAAPLSFAVAMAYQVKKPNKTEKEACDELQNEMTNAQVALGDAQTEMSDMSDALVELSDEAQMANEDANDEIEDKKSEFDMYKASYDALKEKAESGETLTEDEKNLMKELAPIMQQLGVDITTTQEDTTDDVADIYDDMGSYQEGYDNAAETMAEAEGLTDYAESFDETTRWMCYVEAASQGLNAASGGQAAIKASAAAAGSLGFNAWAWACAAMGATGAAISGTGAIQQGQWAGDVGTEIHMRRDTQDLNSTTTDMYDENVDVYAGQMEGVEDLELEIPEDMEVPEETDVVTQQVTQDTTQTTSAQNSTTDDKDKDKKEK